MQPRFQGDPVIFVPPTITLRTRQQISAHVLNSLKAAGIHVSPSSRLGRMHRLYHSIKGVLPPYHQDYEIALEAERDMQLLAYTFDYCPPAQASDAYRALLRKLVSDSVLPQLDGQNTPGRDSAFEIFVGGVCTAAQLRPVSWQEPDVICTLDTEKFGFAAKRTKNLKNLIKHVRKAVRQINDSGMSGVVALDLALAFNPENRRFLEMPDTIFLSEYNRHLRATWSEVHKEVQDCLSESQVLGVIVHDYHVRLTGAGWQLAGMTFRVPNFSGSVEVRRRFERLTTLYIYGLPNQTEFSGQPQIPG